MATYNSNRWDEWMQAALAGNQNAYRLLLTDLRPWLTAFFGKRVHQNVIEDLVQDTLMTLHAKRQTFDPQYPFGPWIAAVARHRWIDHMRKTLRYVEMQMDDDFPSQEPARDESAKHDVKTLLKLIPATQAQIIEMVKLQEMTIEEVSQKTGHSPSNVKIMVHRGMKKMMLAVEEVHDE
ncbi:MAG: sigma-70 family RNA polymerase sigma factor [Holosporales bacterium]|jgi:RNA polymerase sigma-70 factor (ECF subfamily)